jgi:hypothetical protein
MRCSSDDIFSCEQPVPPSEASHVVECLEVQEDDLRVAN